MLTAAQVKAAVGQTRQVVLVQQEIKTTLLDFSKQFLFVGK